MSLTHCARRTSAWRIAAIALVVVWFFLGGIGHFVFADAVLSIVPTGLPWRREAVWITGVLELLGAVGVLVPSTRALAGWGLFALTLCVTPANVFMWLHAERFPAIPEWLLLARLGFQLLLLGAIAVAAHSSGLEGRGERLKARRTPIR